MSYGPWGGNGGTAFDDGVYTGVRQLNLTRTSGIVSMKVLYDRDGRSIWGYKNGGTGAVKSDKIVFDFPFEVLTHITGYMGSLMYMGPKVIKSLTFHTTKKTYGPYGDEQGIPFSSNLREGRIVGFFGRNGWYIDCIGVHVVEGKVCTPQPSKDVAVGLNNGETAMVYARSWANKLSPPKIGWNEEAPYGVIKESAPQGPGPWGGDGGRIWDDGVFCGIKQIYMTRGDYINSIQIEYDRNGQSVWSVRHGAAGEAIHQIILDYPHEIVTCVSGYYSSMVRDEGHKVIRSLTIYTSRGKYGPFGEEIGTFFTSAVTEGKVVGFHGRSSLYLDAIGDERAGTRRNCKSVTSFSNKGGLYKGCDIVLPGYSRLCEPDGESGGDQASRGCGRSPDDGENQGEGRSVAVFERTVQGKTYFLFKFRTAYDQNFVLLNQLWNPYGHSMILLSYEARTPIEPLIFMYVPFWVKFDIQDPFFGTPNFLYEFDQSLGQVLVTEPNTTNRRVTKNGYRARVVMDIYGAFHPAVWAELTDGSILIRTKYEATAVNFYSTCFKMGYRSSGCTEVLAEEDMGNTGLAIIPTGTVVHEPRTHIHVTARKRDRTRTRTLGSLPNPTRRRFTGTSQDGMGSMDILGGKIDQVLPGQAVHHNGQAGLTSHRGGVFHTSEIRGEPDMALDFTVLGQLGHMIVEEELLTYHFEMGLPEGREGRRDDRDSDAGEGLTIWEHNQGGGRDDLVQGDQGTLGLGTPVLPQFSSFGEILFIPSLSQLLRQEGSMSSSTRDLIPQLALQVRGQSIRYLQASTSQVVH
ncbi:hypothetical protein GIB67_023409 [Kingdonia uniflora]|uniref:Jacalin-type lectin domain-containing protein n=1 Tax=Kingdonia uniflora TaxID=39325 RepID=A0A7J7LI13_9MAGN|nr:hypothetical protein GIB67_023409 [Kingdonia uniflora]